MPELPEVETVRRSLEPRLVGRRIVSARLTSRLVTPGDRSRLASRVAGRSILAVRRRGKFLLFDLDHGVLSVHLGMTGRLLLDATPGTHTRAEFTLDDGILLYDDARQFGRIAWSPGLPPRVARLGPEPMEVSAGDFVVRLRSRRGRIKPLLLDQRFLAGVGNIYADEALFRAGIHPRAAAARLSVPRARRLHQSIVEVLGEAIALGGSSISDYVDGQGRPGEFQLQHRVYGREGEPCVNCGARVRRIVLAQRSAHVCPKCQRR